MTIKTIQFGEYLTIQTFPQRGFVSADIYSCKNGMNTQIIIDYFTDTFKLTDVETNFIEQALGIR